MVKKYLISLLVGAALIATVFGVSPDASFSPEPQAIACNTSGGSGGGC